MTVLTGNPHDRKSDTYLMQVRPVEYQILEAVAMEQVGLGVSAVLSAPHVKELLEDGWVENFQSRLAAEGFSTGYCVGELRR